MAKLGLPIQCVIELRLNQHGNQKAYDDLIKAANLGDARTVAAFVDRGLDVNSVDPRGETLLIIASRAGHLDQRLRHVVRVAAIDQ